MPRMTIRQEAWPTARPFIIARGAQTAAEVVVVELVDGDFRGRGECEPQDHYGESMASVLAQIESIRTSVEDGIDRETLLQTLAPGAARNAVDCALWDLEAKRNSASVWDLAGVPRPEYIVTDFTISLDTPETMHEEALGYAGWPVLKLKLGGDGKDIERVQAVREAAPGARFTIDANESWTPQQIVEMAPTLEALGVVLIEQPLPAGQDAALVHISSPVPLCADESCHTRASLDAIRGRYDFVNIKLDKTGGLTEALHLAQAAKKAGFRLMTGCMTGTSLAMAPATVVASLCEFADVDGALMLAKDRDHGMTCDRGRLRLPSRELWG